MQRSLTSTWSRKYETRVLCIRCSHSVHRNLDEERVLFLKLRHYLCISHYYVHLPTGYHQLSVPRHFKLKLLQLELLFFHPSQFILSYYYPYIQIKWVLTLGPVPTLSSSSCSLFFGDEIDMFTANLTSRQSSRYLGPKNCLLRWTISLFWLCKGPYSEFLQGWVVSLVCIPRGSVNGSL